MIGSPRIVVRDSPEQLLQPLLHLWRQAAGEAVVRRGKFAAALSGGRTPARFYRALARAPGLPWAETHLFLVDERGVPQSSEESNARLVHESLLDAMPRSPGGVHFPLVGEAGVGEAAGTYAAAIERFFGGEPAVFDLMLLGLGADGHTASLFPGSPGLLERERSVVAVPSTPTRLSRVSLTLPVINAARRVVFLVTGVEKRETLGRVLAGDADLPAGLVRPEGGTLEIFADRAALPAAG